MDERLSALRPCRTKARDLMHGLDRLRYVGAGAGAAAGTGGGEQKQGRRRSRSRSWGGRGSKSGRGSRKGSGSGSGSGTRSDLHQVLHLAILWLNADSCTLWEVQRQAPLALLPGLAFNPQHCRHAHQQPTCSFLHCRSLCPAATRGSTPITPVLCMLLTLCLPLCQAARDAVLAQRVSRQAGPAGLL